MNLEEIFNKIVNETIINKVVFHTSNPKHREAISKEGLIPKQESWGNAIGSDYNKELGDKGAIFVLNNGEHYDSTYDDDIWEIDTTNLNNEWFVDKYVSGGLYTLTPISVNHIKLIYKGTGKDML